ncbi:hypothetical protein ABPG74_013666 [Tetrahymena malaccensis]
MSDVIIIKDRRGNKIGEVRLDLSDKNSNVLLLKKEISKIRKIAPIRQWLTIGDDDNKTILDDNKRVLTTYPVVKNGVEVVVKDLGIQLGWTTVFYAEYLGPIIFYGAFYLIGRSRGEMSTSQNIGLTLGVLHYVKRILETLYIHVFSRDSMPLASCWKNFLHYWIFFGTFIGVEYFMYYKDPGYNNLTKGIWVGLWALFEFLNFQCHKTLSNIRTEVPSKTLEDGSSVNKRRKIPTGWGFDQVSCANYLWETLAWVAFSGFSRCYTSYFFTAVSFYQMFVWALGKQRRYKKEFGKEFPRGRKAIIPFVI